ncbi:hypothetical protein AHiyo1_48980 [Arthrobacter sp. Hiyo1]|uniref:hypothetical protein n=1 Tax=Arthrobacter sp. Hiyo1 TaxID=1588020 RepID=UPI0006A38531|nr:hypothetical protein [Arthrobacter sp. Hiyo1]GAP61221.1 hypothetical protein AHiyo1_48980 [Arthrobacter sp. Hiyo1]
MEPSRPKPKQVVTLTDASWTSTTPSVGSRCTALQESTPSATPCPGPGSRAALDVDTTDPHDIWIDGASDANHPDPLIFGLFFLIGPAVAAFALWNELTDYGRIRKLLASGAQWQQFEATVTRKTGSRSGITVRLEAEDLSGNVCPFNVFYRFVSPIGPVGKGDRIKLTVLADGKWQALIWRPDRMRIYVAHISRSL